MMDVGASRNVDIERRYREKATGFEGSVQVAVERQRRRQGTCAAGGGLVEFKFVLCGFFLVVDRRGFILI